MLRDLRRIVDDGVFAGDDVSGRDTLTRVYRIMGVTMEAERASSQQTNR